MARSYLSIHRTHNQKMIDGIPVNPTLPPDFYTVTEPDRDPDEIDDWYGRPYVIRFNWVDREAQYRAQRAQGMPPEYEEGFYSEDWWPAEGSDESFEQQLSEFRKRWYESFPDGTRYEIHCMGGAVSGDRTAICCWGGCASLVDAVLVARAGHARHNFPEIFGRLVHHREHRESFE